MRIIYILPFFIISQLALSFGNWIKYYDDDKGTSYYYKDVVRDESNIIFYNMIDRLRPNSKGIYCTMDKRVADCNTFSLKYIEYNFFKGPLCIGNPESVPSEMIKSFGWKKNIPGSTDFNIIKKLCDNLEK